jgi:hypothetical protein
MTPFLTPLYCLSAFAVGFVAGTIIAFAYVGAKTIAPMAGIGDADPVPMDDSPMWEYYRIAKSYGLLAMRRRKDDTWYLYCGESGYWYPTLVAKNHHLEQISEAQARKECPRAF